MPNITVQGYPLSREQRDHRTLSFQTIHLCDVRRDEVL